MNESEKIIKNSENYIKYKKKILTKKNIKNYFFNNFKITIKDLALMGILMGLYLIVASIVNFTLLGATRISFEYIFYILFGIIFGPVKGIFFAILSDTFSLLLTGRIATWMIHYAMIPPLIALFSYLFFLLYRLKSDKILAIPVTLSFVSLISVIAFFSIGWIQDSLKIEGINGQTSLFSIIAVTVMTIFIIGTNIFCFIKYFKTKKEIYKRTIFMLALVIFIIIFARWLWGPIAFIAYYNQFIANGRTIYTIENNFALISFPIILKSAFVIPLFTLIIVPLTDVTKMLQKKYFQNYNYSTTNY